jgi:hypothetical protein
LPVSCFDPALVEIALSFLFPRLLQCPFGLGASVRKPARRRRLFGIASFGPLARGAEINELTRQKLDLSESCCGHLGPLFNDSREDGCVGGGGQ